MSINYTLTPLAHRALNQENTMDKTTVENVTLIEALQAIANRSFYESCKLTHNEDDTYTVEDDFDEFDVTWTYENGLEFVPDPVDHTRLMDPCESFTDASHILWHFETLLKEMTESDCVSIGFTYQPVTNYDYETDNDVLDDDVAGWVLVAGWTNYDRNAI